MALARCLKTHTPRDASCQRYIRPLQLLKCEVANCEHSAVIWLDPEEVREYEWGTRTFWEPSTFATMRAGDLGVEMLPWSPWAAFRPLVKRWGSSFQLGFRRYLAKRLHPDKPTDLNEGETVWQG